MPRCRPIRALNCAFSSVLLLRSSRTSADSGTPSSVIASAILSASLRPRPVPLRPPPPERMMIRARPARPRMGGSCQAATHQLVRPYLSATKNDDRIGLGQCRHRDHGMLSFERSAKPLRSVRYRPQRRPRHGEDQQRGAQGAPSKAPRNHRAHEQTRRQHRRVCQCDEPLDQGGQHCDRGMPGCVAKINRASQPRTAVGIPPGDQQFSQRGFPCSRHRALSWLARGVRRRRRSSSG